MGDHILLERYLWFDRQVRLERYPNAPALARRFEVSEKTARRDIDRMAERFGAPLHYDPGRRGYCYTRAFDLPPLQVAQNELLAILLAQKLLSGSAGGFIGEEIRTFGRKLFAATGRLGLSEDRIATSFSTAWNGYTPAEAETFRLVADALTGNRFLSFDYFAPSTNVTSRRTVEPYHLLHYLGGWYLFAWCPDAGWWRKFNLGHMRHLETGKNSFTPRPRSEWQGELEGAFGIFQGAATITAVLRFNAFRARWVRSQHWHLAQAIVEQPDGGIELRFPVADFRELKLKILQFGGDVEVLEPAELRAEVMEEIGRMARVYEKK